MVNKVLAAVMSAQITPAPVIERARSLSLSLKTRKSSSVNLGFSVASDYTKYLLWIIEYSLSSLTLRRLVELRLIPLSFEPTLLCVL